jgi:putative peptidoglycan lipid II flippase
MRASSTDLLATVLVYFSLGLFPFCAFQLLLRAFYAMQDTRTPALINVGENAIFIAGNVVLFRYLSVGGLALSNGIGYSFASVVALLVLRRRLHGLDGRALAGVLARILVAGAAAGAAALVASRAMGAAVATGGFGPELLQVGAAALAGVFVFLGMAVAFRLEELRMIKSLVLARVRSGVRA